MENYLQDQTNPQSQTLEQNPTSPTTLQGPISIRGRQRPHLFKKIGINLLFGLFFFLLLGQQPKSLLPSLINASIHGGDR